MKLYIGDYLGDTQHLSCLEHGAYILLIMAYWQNGGPLENDPKLLRRLTRTSPKEFQKCSENVLKMFKSVDGKLVHKRVDLEISKRAQVSTAARDSVSARWNGRNTDVLPTNSERNTTPIVHSPESIDNTKNTSSATPPKPEQDESFKAFYDAYPRKEARGQALKAYNATIRKGITAEAILDRLLVYKARIEKAGIERQFMCLPAIFLHNLDDYEAEPEAPEPEYKPSLPERIATPEERAMLDRMYGRTRDAQ